MKKESSRTWLFLAAIAILSLTIAFGCDDDQKGPYGHDAYVLPQKVDGAPITVYYPTDAPLPLDGIVYCPTVGEKESTSEALGEDYASRGIVFLVTTAGEVTDLSQQTAIEVLRAENARAESAIFGQLSDRLGLLDSSTNNSVTWLSGAEVASLDSGMSLSETTPPADLRCCKKTKIIDGVPDITYHSYPTCPTLPGWKDVGPSPPCPPTSGCN